MAELLDGTVTALRTEDARWSVARSLPGGRSVLLEGAGHDLRPDLIAPVLERFFGAGAGDPDVRP